MGSRFHRTLVEESSDTVSIVDEDGVIRYVSPSVEDLLGFEPDELVGEGVYDYQHPQDRAAIAGAIERVVTGDSDEETVEARARRADGSWCWVEARVQDRLDDPDIDGVLINSRDITERRKQDDQFQQLAQEYRTLLRTVDDGIFFVNVETVDGEYEFTFERVSRGYEEQTGLTTDEMRGSTPEEVFGETVGGELREKYSRCADAGEPIGYQEEVPVETGARFWQTNLAPVVTDGTVRKIVGITRDITARVGREQRLEDQKQQLDEFAGVVSHDLRNPLGVAKGRLELLADDIDSKHIRPIRQSLDRMEELISDTLVLARQGEVIAEQTAISVLALLDDCWDGVETEDATLDVEDGLTVEGDERVECRRERGERRRRSVRVHRRQDSLRRSRTVTHTVELHTNVSTDRHTSGFESSRSSTASVTTLTHKSTTATGNAASSPSVVNDTQISTGSVRG